MYESMPMILTGAHVFRTEKDTRKLSAIEIVYAGYSGDMDVEFANALLDYMDFFNNMIRCSKLENMLFQLKKMVEEEIMSFSLRE